MYVYVCICVYVYMYAYMYLYTHTHSVAFSSQVNYTDWVTATCWGNLVPAFADRGVSHGECDGSPTVVNLSFLYRNVFVYVYVIVYSICVRVCMFVDHLYGLVVRVPVFKTHRSRICFPALPNFLSSGGSGRGSTQSRENKWGANWKKSSDFDLENWD
jgi:hypothetical protein